MPSFERNDDSMGPFLLVLSVAIIFVLFWWTYYECTDCTWRSPQEIAGPSFSARPARPAGDVTRADPLRNAVAMGKLRDDFWRSVA
jgi:hypothetical protein